VIYGICDVDPRTVERLLEKAGKRAQDFHRLQLDLLAKSPQAVQLDEMHARVAKSASDAAKKGLNPEPSLFARLARRAARGFTRRWMW